MALVLNDRVKETSTTTGTGNISLAGAVSGFQTFVAGIGNSNTTYYAIVNDSGTEFEVGVATVNDASPDTISGRTNANVFESSNSDNVVDFSAGTKTVFCTLPASKAVFEDADNHVTLPHDLFIEGGLIDLKNDGGAVSQIKFYCESSNAHAQTLIGAPHSEAASNTLTLPSSGGSSKLVSATSTATLTNKTLTSPKINEDVAVTSTATELNILDGVTATTSELNILDGVTSTATELNILDGVTATTAELNYSDTGSSVGTVVASKVVTVDSNKDVSSFRNVTATTFIGNIDAVDGDFDGTLEADAITIGGTALNTVIAGVTVTNATTAAVATTVTISDNESTNEDNAIIFTSGGDVDGGNIGLESDGDLTYNPSTGRLTATQLAGTLQTAAQANITSLGTLTTLTVDNVIINGSTIGHTGDTDLMTVASGVLTVAGEVSMTTLDIGGTNVAATAAELNIMDGGTAASSTTVVDADRVVFNDNGTMKQVAMTDISGYTDAGATALAIALG